MQKVLAYRFSTSFAELQHSARSHRVKDINCLKELLAYLYRTQPSMNCIYFRNAANPVYTNFNEINHFFEDVNKQIWFTKNYPIDFWLTTSFVWTQIYREEQNYILVQEQANIIVPQLNRQKLGSFVGANELEFANKLQYGQEFMKTTKFVPGTDVWEGPQDLWMQRFNSYQKEFDYWAR